MGLQPELPKEMPIEPEGQWAHISSNELRSDSTEWKGEAMLWLVDESPMRQGHRELNLLAGATERRHPSPRELNLMG